MKIMMKMFLIIALLIVVASCATTPIVLPDRYNLDADLQEVTRLLVAGSSNWEQVDNQSVMFTATGGKRYLVILERPLEEMSSKIGFPGNISSITAGHDKIYVGSSSNKRYYTMEKIYELEGMDQVKEVKERLNNN